MQARRPAFLDFDETIPDDFNETDLGLPANYDSLSDEGQRVARRIRGKKLLRNLHEAEISLPR